MHLSFCPQYLRHLKSHKSNGEAEKVVKAPIVPPLCSIMHDGPIQST